MSDAWEYIESMSNALADIERGVAGDDVPGTMRAVAYLNERLAHLAAELVERGVQKGMTQRRMAECLDVPQSALRGARKEFA